MKYERYIFYVFERYKTYSFNDEILRNLLCLKKLYCAYLKPYLHFTKQLIFSLNFIGPNCRLCSYFIFSFMFFLSFFANEMLLLVKVLKYVRNYLSLTHVSHSCRYFFCVRLFCQPCTLCVFACVLHLSVQ